MVGERDIHHGTAIAVSGHAALIRGPSGAGKSDVALRCIYAAPGALAPHGVALVADDRVILERSLGLISALAPDPIRGKLEVRGLGVIDNVPFVATARLALVVDLAISADIERFPINEQTVSLLGVTLPLVRVAAFEASAPLKILLALKACTGFSGPL